MNKSAGLLLYRVRNRSIEVLLVHPGGPFWAKRDEGAWSIPKGEYDDDEDPLAAAIRETEEEIGLRITGTDFELPAVKLKSGKIIHAWACQHDFDISTLTSNSFEMEWPPKSGKLKKFPEVDRAEWFSTEIAMQKINEGQQPFLIELQNKLGEH